MLFVILRSSSPVTVPKVLQVAHQTKRIRHKAGDDSELYQYVQYDTVQPQVKKGPRIIKLDDDAVDKDKYKPPENLIVHLSKIPMPELQPKVKNRSASTTSEILDILPSLENNTISTNQAHHHALAQGAPRPLLRGPTARARDHRPRADRAGRVDRRRREARGLPQVCRLLVVMDCDGLDFAF